MLNTYKICLLSAFIILSLAYTEENNVLVLTDQELPIAIKQFNYILIQFYAPWCIHCKNLIPIYDQIATQFKNQGSPIRLARIDVKKYPNVKEAYGVIGLPTIIFYNHGQSQKYHEKRSKEQMVNWLLKKNREPFTTISSSDLQDLLRNGKVSIVYYGNINTHNGKIIENFARVDDFNTYYNVAESDQPEGTVQIYRPFGETVSTIVSESISKWIKLYERPIVYPFNNRTLSQIFHQGALAIILFHSQIGGAALIDTFNEAAQNWRIVQSKSLIFTDIPTDNEHYNGLADHIKIDTNQAPIIIFDGAKRMKYILTKSPDEIISKDILSFIKNVQNKRIKEYKFDEQVTYQQELSDDGL